MRTFEVIGNQMVEAKIDISKVINVLREVFPKDFENLAGRVTAKSITLKATMVFKGKLESLPQAAIVAARLAEAESLARRALRLGHNLVVAKSLLEIASKVFPHDK